MGSIDITKAERPTRNRVGGADRDRAAKFRARMPPSARRSVYIRMELLLANRAPPANPQREEVPDPAAAATEIKQMARDMGADAVGIAELDPRLVFTQAEELGHTSAIVFGMSMEYDLMGDIGPRSQEEVHRVYHHLDDMGVRIANQIAARGYSAAMQPNEGDIPLPAFAYLAGLGELGKHGSMISPTMGSSFRLGAVTTDMPLAADGPQDFGFDEICTKCQICTRFCPGDALGPEKKTVNGVTRWYVDTPECEPYFHKLFGCKICLMVCPLNSRGDNRGAYKKLARDLAKTKTAEGLLALIESRTDLRIDEFTDGEGGAKTQQGDEN